MPASLPGHSCLPHTAWLHDHVQVLEGLDSSAVEQRSDRREGGRGMFVRSGAPTLAPGTLLVEGSPVILAADYPSLKRYLLALCGSDMQHLPQDEHVVVPRAESKETICHAVGIMYAGPGMQVATLRQRVRGVLAHNMHSADPLPWNGKSPELSGPIGLWPCGSLINHSFLGPNVARSFEQNSKKVQYRAIRPLHAGDELLDNYLDSCCSHAERVRTMRDQHGLVEPRDALDCPQTVLAEAAAAVDRAHKLLSLQQHERADAAEAALYAMLPTREKLLQDGPPQDPALVPFFATLGEIACAAGLPDLAASNWERSLELITRREPFSYRGAMIAARLAILSQSAAEETALAEGTAEHGEAPSTAEWLADAGHWLQEAQEHWRVVFGCGSSEEVFKTRNPRLFPGHGQSRRCEDVLPWWGTHERANDGEHNNPQDTAEQALPEAQLYQDHNAAAPKRPKYCSDLLPADDDAWGLFG